MPMTQRVCKDCSGDFKPGTSKQGRPSRTTRCPECVRQVHNARQRLKWVVTPDKIKASCRRYNSAHPDMVRKWRTRYYLANTEKIRIYSLGWKQRNPEKVALYRSRALQVFSLDRAPTAEGAGLIHILEAPTDAGPLYEWLARTLSPPDLDAFLAFTDCLDAQEAARACGRPVGDVEALVGRVRSEADASALCAFFG